jgi:hypothetical protein
MKRSSYCPRISYDFLHGNAYYDWWIRKLNATSNDRSA